MGMCNIFNCSKYNGPSGLTNVGETCYMNAMIQALASSKRLIQEFEKSSRELNHIESYNIFVDLLKDINKKDNRTENIRDNSEKLKKVVNLVQWDRTSQQDTFQLLSFFINGIEKIVASRLERKFVMPPKFSILHSFSENASFNKVQHHLAIAVPLCGRYKEKPGVSIKSLLDGFFQPSIIDDGPHTTSMYMFDHAPDVLILHIQANEWSPELGQYIKPTYHIRYGKKMAYNFDICELLNGTRFRKVEVTYRLTAVVHHMGNVQGGHYVTYRKRGKHWYLANDEQIEESFKFDVTPYVLVYEKENFVKKIIHRFDFCLSNLN